MKGTIALKSTMENGGKPQTATHVDTLCEGLAVEKLGDLPAALVWLYREHLEVMTISVSWRKPWAAKHKPEMRSWGASRFHFLKLQDSSLRQVHVSV